MSEYEEKAKRIQSVMSLPGWRDILDIAETEMGDAKERIFSYLNRAPEKLTTKTAVKYAARARALEDFLEQVNDAVKILEPQSRKGQAEGAGGQ